MKNILPSEILYKDIKQRGLGLSTLSTLIIPQSPQPQPTFFQKLGSMLSKQKQMKVSDTIIPHLVFSSIIIVTRKYIALVYKYYVDPQTSQLHIEFVEHIQLQNSIKRIAVCDDKYTNDKGQSPILFICDEGIHYVTCDLKSTTISEKNFLKCKNIIAIQWITDKQCIAVCFDGYLHSYIISEGVLKLRNSIPIVFQKPQGYYIRKGWIISNIDQQQETVFTFFYITTNSLEEEVKANIYIKQLRRNLSAQIQILSQKDYLLDSNNIIYRDQLFINGVGEYFCIQIHRGVLIAKKKYDKYMLIDNLDKINDTNQVYLCTKGIVVSLGSDVMQLSSIQFADPKCPLRICDVIDLPSQIKSLRPYFYKIQPILFGKQYSLIIIYKNEEKIYLSNLVKSDPMQKMMKKAKQTRKEQLVIVRDMAMNLGIKKKDFYLKLWVKSQKQDKDIEQYLLPCCDVPSIKKQLKFTLRRRFVPVVQMMKYLDKISQILIENLKVNLNQTQLKQYMKNQFLRRKLKMEESNKNLDYNIFQKIYNSSLHTLFCDIIAQQIDPKIIQIDPLHAMVDPSPYKELKSLKQVFQQFKLVILEDYKIFLIEILQDFPHKLQQLIENFFYIFPNYPFQINVQKPSKTNEPPVLTRKKLQVQPIWFQQITIPQWRNSVLTKQRLIKQFYEYYPTSRIIEAVDQFANSLYGRQHKRWKHGLITLSLQQYTQKVKSLEGINLYLELCQYANEKSLQKNQGPDLTNKFLKIFEEKNGLKGKDLQYCRLYANMHYFMLKNRIIQKQKTNIRDLTQLMPQDLIALFFLENKQQKDHIFSDFMMLYEDKQQFVTILQKFIKSENCSQIQIAILMEDFANLGDNFQKIHQQIISALISGMCMKYTITQTLPFLQTNEETLIDPLIERIQLSQDIALRINRIKLLQYCKSIFINFKCQKMTYHEILSLQQDFGIFKLLIEKYFNDDYHGNQMKIEPQIQKQIADQDNQIQTFNLQSPLSLLWVLLQLQERVFYSIRREDLLIVFAQGLIQWKQFEIIKQMVQTSDSNTKSIIQGLQINVKDFKNQIINRSLDFIYMDPNIVYDIQTKEQIINILNIDQENNSCKIREIAKLQLVQIFESWQQAVHPSDINAICQQWALGNKIEIVDFLLQKYIDKMDFTMLKKVYTELQITAKQSTYVITQNQQFVEFSTIYACKLLQKQRYKQIIQILSFIRGLANTSLNYGLQTETFLKIVSEQYALDVQNGRKMIEYFCYNYNNQMDFNIKHIYDQSFDKSVVQFWNREQSITVHQRYLYNKSPYACEYNLDDLWEIVEKTAVEHNTGENKSSLYYNYYFLIMGLTKPEVGLKKLRKISYNLDQLTDSILKFLEPFNTARKKYWILDFDHILRKYLEGLVNIAITRIGTQIQFDGVNKLEAILDFLKESREQNFDLVKSLTKVNSELKSKFKKTERKNRFYDLLDQVAKQQEQRKRREQQMRANMQKVQVQQPLHTGVFMNWKQISEKKRTYTKTESHIFDSQKSLIDYIFDKYQQSPSKQTKMTKQPARISKLNQLFLPIITEQKKVNNIIDLIKNSQHDQLQNYPQQIILQSILQAINQDDEFDLYCAMDLMQSKKIGDQHKIYIYKTVKVVQEHISNKLLNKIFTLDFFLNPLPAQGDKSQLIYEQLRPNLLSIIEDISTSALKNLAHMFGHSLDSSQYSSLIFYDVLLGTASRAQQFKSHSALIAQQCLNGLSQYPDVIVNRYEQILSASKQPQLRNFIKENLSKILEQKDYVKLANIIKQL